MAPTAAPAQHSIWAEGVDPRAFGKPSPLFDTFKSEPGLHAGITGTLLDPKPIFTQCGFLREALLTGGRDYREPLWNQSVLCATFLKNGRNLAHLISKGHPTYSESGTEAKFNLKMAAGAPVIMSTFQA